MTVLVQLLAAVTLGDFLKLFLPLHLLVPTLGAFSFLTGHQSVSLDSSWWGEPRMSDFPPENVFAPRGHQGGLQVQEPLRTEVTAGSVLG